MSDTPHSFSNLTATIERLLFDAEPGATLDWCTFRVRFIHDSGYISVRIFPSVNEARTAFATHGNRFDVPKARVHVEHPDGTITYHPPPPPGPPILSNESVPNLDHENFVWRGYGNNQRGVVKMRVERFLADLNMPSVDDAERLARRVADVLRAR